MYLYFDYFVHCSMHEDAWDANWSGLQQFDNTTATLS